MTRLLLETVFIGMVGWFLIGQTQLIKHSHNSIVMVTLMGWLMVLVIAFGNISMDASRNISLDRPVIQPVIQPVIHPVIKNLKHTITCISGVCYLTMICIVVYVLTGIYSKRHYFWYRDKLECNNTELQPVFVEPIQNQQHDLLPDSIGGMLNSCSLIFIFLMGQFRTIIGNIQYNITSNATHDGLYCFVMLAWLIITIDQEIKVATCSQYRLSGTSILNHIRGLIVIVVCVGVVLMMNTFQAMVHIKNIKRIRRTPTETVLVSNLNKLYHMNHTRGSIIDRIYVLNNRFYYTELLGKSTITKDTSLVPLLNGVSLLVVVVIASIIWNRYRQYDVTSIDQACPVNIHNHLCHLLFLKKSRHGECIDNQPDIV